MGEALFSYCASYETEIAALPHQKRVVATTLPLEVFTLRNFAVDFFRQKLKFTKKKIAKSRFVPPFGDVRGNVHGSSMAR